MSKNITTYEEFEEAKNISGKVLIDFWAPWCGPCRMMMPTIDEIDKEGNITVFKVNTDDADKKIIEEMSIRSIPTLVFFKDGEHVATRVGASSKDKIVGEFK